MYVCMHEYMNVLCSCPLGEGKGSTHGEAKFWCRLQSKQLCTMQGQRRFVLHESTQEWCSVTFSGKTAKRHQPTVKQQWPVSTLSRRSNKQLRLQTQEKRPLLQQTGWHNLLLFTVPLKNVQHSSKNAKGNILQSAHTVA